MEGIYCDIIYCNEDISEAVRDLVINDAEVQVNSEDTITNRGSLTITNDYLLGLSDQMVIQNRGNLVFADSVNPEVVKEKNKHIENSGKIIADISVLSGVTIANRGVIHTSDEEEKVTQEDIFYENMDTLVL